MTAPTRRQVHEAISDALVAAEADQHDPLVGLQAAVDAVMALYADSQPRPDLSTLAGRLRHDAALDPETLVAAHDLAYLADVANALDSQPKLLTHATLVHEGLSHGGFRGHIIPDDNSIWDLPPGTRVVVTVAADR